MLLISASTVNKRRINFLRVIEELGPFKPLEQVNYKDFKSTIENSLKNRLLKLEVKETQVIIEILLDKLNKFQSLISMSTI